MASLVEIGSQEPAEGLNVDHLTNTIPWGRFPGEGTRWTHRPGRKALRSSYSAQVLAATLAVLAVAYFLLRCFQYFSLASDAAHRALAMGGPESDETCSDDRESGDEDKEHGKQEATDAPAPGAVGAVGDGEEQQADWHEVPVATSLSRALWFAEAWRGLLPALTPENAVKFAITLARLAALETGSHLFAPANIQPVRAQVAQAYIILLDEVINTPRTQSAALKVHDEIHKLQDLLREMASTPEPWAMPQLSETRREVLQTIHSFLCGAAQSQASYLLRSMELHVDSNYTIPERVVRSVLCGLEKIFSQRVGQILGTSGIREFTHACQMQAAPWYLYTPVMWSQRDSIRLQSLTVEKRKIINASNWEVQAVGHIGPALPPPGQSDAPAAQQSSRSPLLPSPPSHDSLPRHHVLRPPPGFPPLPPSQPPPLGPAQMFPWPRTSPFPSQPHPQLFYPGQLGDPRLQHPGNQAPPRFSAPTFPHVSQTFPGAPQAPTPTTSGSGDSNAVQSASADGESETDVPGEDGDDVDVMALVQKVLKWSADLSKDEGKK